MVYRSSIVQLSTEENPTKGLQDGSLLYYVDTKQIFIYYKGTWYEQTGSEG